MKSFFLEYNSNNNPSGLEKCISFATKRFVKNRFGKSHNFHLAVPWHKTETQFGSLYHVSWLCICDRRLLRCMCPLASNKMSSAYVTMFDRLWWGGHIEVDKYSWQYFSLWHTMLDAHVFCFVLHDFLPSTGVIITNEPTLWPDVSNETDRSRATSVVRWFDLR